MTKKKKNTSVSKTWLNPGSSTLHPTPTILEISQRGAARIDAGRSNKAGRLRGHLEAAHTVTPAITTSCTTPRPLLTYLYNNGNKRGNEQRLHKHNINAPIKAPGHFLEWCLCRGKLCSNRIAVCLKRTQSLTCLRCIMEELMCDKLITFFSSKVINVWGSQCHLVSLSMLL